MMRRFLAGLLTAGAIWAQGAAAPSFDAASVRPNSTRDPSYTTMNNGFLIVHNLALRACIAAAYGVRRADVIGPEWMDKARFDIKARAFGANRSSPALKMYQALLEERFHLRVHSGTRSADGFELTAANHEILLRDIGPKQADRPIFAAGQRAGATHIVAARGMTMAMLADALSTRLNAPVVDKTGTTDYFAVNLEFRSVQLNSAYAEHGLPTISSALEKAGLRLESAKVDVPTVIVDSIDKDPTAN
jgi:uncharacterized protein (TIGR03435 family)